MAGEMRRRGGGGGGQGGGGGDVIKFYTDDGNGFEISPVTVLVSSVVFIGLVVVMHILGKFAS